jgi:hypothetical protein
MNPTQKNMSHDDGSLFDRLVDGELGEAERRSLLASLDAAPEGWRRCALAFLEAQTWRESFGDFTPAVRKMPPPTIPSPDASPRSPRKQRKPLGAMGTVMAMAASFLVALGLGSWAFHGPRSDTVAPASNQFAGVPGTIAPTPTISAANQDPIRRNSPSASTPWQMVKLQAPGLTGDDRPLQLPAQPRERLDDDFFKTVPNPLPDSVRQAFERTGHAVSMHRELVPVRLKDGRELIIPVDQVEVQYDAHPAY